MTTMPLNAEISNKKDTLTGLRQNKNKTKNKQKNFKKLQKSLKKSQQKSENIYKKTLTKTIHIKTCRIQLKQYSVDI